MSGKGIIFVISGPSGTGKTTLTKELLESNHSLFVTTVSCTTRAPRNGEKDKVDYYFCSEAEFNQKKERGEFLETVEIYGYQYGTLRKEVEKILDRGANVLLVIDVQGANRLRNLIKNGSVVYIFVEPPTVEELERRIRNRKTESEEAIQKRLARAKAELKEKSKYDYVVKNEDLAAAYKEIKSIIERKIMGNDGQRKT